MSTRRGKRYTTSYKEKEHPRQDPYAMLRSPKGPAICRTCLAIYANKRWSFDGAEARRLAASPRTQELVCPACQKIRDDYPEGIVTLKWSNLQDMKRKSEDSSATWKRALFRSIRLNV